MSHFFNKRSSTGIFVPSGNGFVEYKGEKGNGSIKAITNALGYSLDQVYSPDIWEKKQAIYHVCFEIFTRNIIYVLADKKVTYLCEKDIKKYLGDFSVTKKFSSMTINDTLTQGVENGSLKVDFMAKVLNLKNLSRNGMFYSQRISTYLYFTNGVLTDFQYDDGYFPWAKHLQDVNKTVYNWLADIAYKYWPNDDFQAKKEINIQCEAWSSIPDAFGNEYINLHRTENGGANLHMLRVCHYDYPITFSQFKEINHGRYSIFEEDRELNSMAMICGNFKYYFDIVSEELIKSEMNI